MADLDALQEDEDLLKGLEECERIEKKELEAKKANFTPRSGMKQGDVEQAAQGE